MRTRLEEASEPHKHVTTAPEDSHGSEDHNHDQRRRRHHWSALNTPQSTDSNGEATRATPRQESSPERFGKQRVTAPCTETRHARAGNDTGVTDVAKDVTKMWRKVTNRVRMIERTHRVRKRHMGVVRGADCMARNGVGKWDEHVGRHGTELPGEKRKWETKNQPENTTEGPLPRVLIV